MKTITFYSYKGGVGRTLALSNIATRLAEFGKKVCMLDFDLEAPGIPYKFQASLRNHEFRTGLVDYLHYYIQHRQAPLNIKDYVIQLHNRHNYQFPIELIPAGNILDKNYWRKLSTINWEKFFYEEDSTGVEFFFDLKEKIKQEINPDYLLIDSRTGITEIAGITLSLLADEVVLLSVNNEESLVGTQQVLKTILNSINPVLGTPPKVHFVMSRVPYSVDTRSHRKKIVTKAKKRLNLFLEESNLDFLIEKALTIHSDPELQITESLKIAYEEDEAASPIGKDYLTLFKELAENDFTTAEKKQFKLRREFEKLKHKIQISNNTNERILLLTQALQEYKEIDELYILVKLGEAYIENKQFDKANIYFQQVVKINPSINYKISLALTYESLENYPKALDIYLPISDAGFIDEAVLNDIALCYKRLNKFKPAEQYYKKAIKEFPDSAMTYNNYADLLRIEGRYKEALPYSFKSLEISPLNAVFNATLAEIYAHLDNDIEFYRNITLALNIAPDTIWNLIKKERIYQRFMEEKKFVNLLERCGIDITDYD